MSTRTRLLLVTLASVAMTAFVTWPQALHMTTHVVSHQDPEFSIWRLGWFAHALATNPRHLFDANIFYPSRHALAYSDAMLVEGVLAAPLFWLGLPPVLIYNLLLLGAMAASGVAAFVLAHHLTGRSGPSLFAAAVFTMAPYRIEHFMHLELQWAMWVPLAFWALHITLERGGRSSIKYGLLAGFFVWLQIGSSVYYGVFLAMAVVAFMAVATIADWRQVAAAVPGLAAGAALCAALTAPYLWVYLGTAHSMGTRDMGEIGLYSARLWSYFASPPQNLLWGWSSTGPEVNLFLGWSIIALALVGALLYRAPKQRAIYIAVAATAIILSFGLNTPVYRWIIAVVPPLKGLRSPSRFGIVSCCAIAVLAAFGADVVQARARKAGGRWYWAALPVLFLFVMLDYTNTGMYLMDLSVQGDSSVYKVVKSTGPGVVVELPMPTAGTLPGNDTDYEMWSLKHWNPLVNGYSGYYPPDYIETLVRMETFPDEDSISRLRRLDVRYVIVHCKFYVTGKTQETMRDECPSLLARIGARRELKPYGKYTDPYGAPAYLFVLNP